MAHVLVLVCVFVSCGRWQGELREVSPVPVSRVTCLRAMYSPRRNPCIARGSDLWLTAVGGFLVHVFVGFGVDFVGPASRLVAPMGFRLSVKGSCTC